MLTDIRSFKNQKDEKGTNLSGLVPTKAKDASSGPDEALNYSLDNLTEEEITQEHIKYLEEKGISESMILSALDKLLTTGNFVWGFKILDKIDCAFKVRPAFVNTIVINKMEKDSPKTLSKFQDIINMNNLAGALHRYGENQFDIEDEESFNKVKLFVDKLPFILVQKLLTELTIFDRLITVATSRWAMENFTKPQSEE